MLDSCVRPMVESTPPMIGEMTNNFLKKVGLNLPLKLTCLSYRLVNQSRQLVFDKIWGYCALNACYFDLKKEGE